MSIEEKLNKFKLEKGINKSESENNDEKEEFLNQIKINKCKIFQISNKNNQLITFEIIQESKEKIIFNVVIKGLNKLKTYQRKLLILDFINKNPFYKQFDNVAELFSEFLVVVNETNCFNDKLKICI